MYAKESYAVEGEDKTAAERREREVEKRALEGVDRVERVLLGLGHNLLFSPPTSNDPKHDAALASRIAALNMLDLSLGHLGVVTTHPDGTLDEEVVQGLDEIVKAVGKGAVPLLPTFSLGLFANIPPSLQRAPQSSRSSKPPRVSPPRRKPKSSSAPTNSSLSVSVSSRRSASAQRASHTNLPWPHPRRPSRRMGGCHRGSRARRQ